MKKTTARLLLIFMVLTMVVSPLFSLVSFADDMWAEDYYRAYSTTGGLNSEEQESLDSNFIEFMSEYGVDFAALALTSDRLDRDIEDFARDYFESCNFGYGDDRTGFQLLYVTDTDEVAIVPIGAAEKMVDEDLIAFAEEDASSYYIEHGEWGVMYAGFGYIRNEIVENAQRGADAVPALGGATAAPVAGGNSGLPSWFPEDISSFQFFHDEDAPRIVDNADLLTDDEEAELEHFIALVREVTSHDLVVVTDVTDYGLGQDAFADDFYDFNGYGCGDEREGALFFCDMDPYDRGGWCSCSGSDTMRLYTEDVANDIDDVVYDYLSQGEYFKAFQSWISLMGNLFNYGYPFAPDWMPSRYEDTPARIQDASASRVVDEKDVLTDAQEADLAARIAKISEKYGVDVVLACPNYMGRSLYIREYNDKLWQYKGYGLGTNYDAIVMSISGGYCYVNGYGNAEDALTQVNRDRIEEKAESAMEGGSVYDAAVSYLNDAEHMLKTGRVQKPLGSWIASAIAGLMGGSVFGGISSAAAQGKMKTPRTATTAEDYLVRNSISITALYDNYLGTYTDRIYDPPEERTSSGGGGGGGHSSYSGGHTSHSGASHSGSGRKF